MWVISSLAGAAALILSTAGGAFLGVLAESGASVVSDVQAIETPRRGTVITRWHAVDAGGDRLQLVHGPWTASGNEGWDLGLVFRIEWSGRASEELSEERLLYRHGSTFAYEVMTPNPSARRRSLVVVRGDTAVLYIDDHLLTGVAQTYDVSARYRESHARRDPGDESQWTAWKSVGVSVVPDR